MKFDKTLIITSVICLLPAAFGAAVYGSLPEMVPSHWNFNGEIDGYTPKAIAAFGLPIMMFALNFITHFVLNKDTKRKNAGKMAVVLGKFTVPVLSLLMVPMSFLNGLGVEMPVHYIAPFFVGAVFIISGNYMPKCKQNYTVGIKIPWTLNSEENWNKTHRLAGKVWIVGGFVIALCPFLNGAKYTFFAVMMVLLFVPYIYSYYLYRKGI